MMTNSIPWLIAGAALFATILNIRKDRRCFLIWTGTNLYWTVYDAVNGLYAQAALFMVYLVLALVGLWKWRKNSD
ncbi:MAG TPA: nicotinamide mononucleotide transporter [Methylomusa anaerophila]|uniref:nicotinamide mononucleotide transporter n=1 Tax=Methylomusa anaerophila TaxID=1930071 RepID=UPI001E286FEF|nr:nicotinamide mononucleotide transporter [Methylomusa anaerophila]HML88911.1 nicotinamide mononucleotide transporter [Methylomusa anaerophila]